MSVNGYPFSQPGKVPPTIAEFQENDRLAQLTNIAREREIANRKGKELAALEGEDLRRVELARASTFAVKRVKWLWENRVPMGEVTLIAGRGGAGKSTMLSRMTADITNGTLPGEFLGAQRAVLYVVNEDSIEYTVGPRMMAAGANLDLIYYLSVPGGNLTLPRDCERIADRALEVSAACVMLDPLSANLETGKGGIDPGGKMRHDMQQIRKMCESVNIAAIGLAHTRKAMTSNLMDAILGSTELGNVCRSAMGVMADDSQQGTYIISQEKSNLGRLDIPSYRYRIEGVTFPSHGEIISTSRVEVIGEDEIKVSDMLADNMDTGNSGKLGEAIRWLQEYLEQTGTAAKKEVLAIMKKEGYSQRTAERAAARLKVVSETNGFGSGKMTTWAIKITRQASPETNDQVSANLAHTRQEID